MVASEDFSLGNFSVEWFCLICCNISTVQPISPIFLVSRFEGSDSVQLNNYFQQSLIEDFNGQQDINSIVLTFFGLKFEAAVEIGESSA